MKTIKLRLTKEEAKELHNWICSYEYFDSGNPKEDKKVNDRFDRISKKWNDAYNKAEEN